MRPQSEPGWQDATNDRRAWVADGGGLPWLGRYKYISFLQNWVLVVSQIYHEPGELQQTEPRLDNFKCGQRIRMTTKWRKYCRGQLDGGYGMDCDNEWGYSLFIMSLQSVPGDHWTIFRAAESGWIRITGDISERLLQITWTQSHIPRVDQS